MQIVKPYGVSAAASMQENIVLELEDLYMMVERVREGKRVNGGEGVTLCGGSSDRSLPGLLISDKIISVASGLKIRCM